MQKIIPHLWFDTQAKEAAEFYTSIFPNSKVTTLTQLHDTPSGDTDIVGFELNGYSFLSISAGPLFSLTPAISFMVNFDPSRDPQAEEHLKTLWAKLFEGGSALMELQEYPFSKLYGWVQDKFGVSWQLILTDPNGEERPYIIPSMLFVQDVCGKAEEAMQFYTSVFHHSRIGTAAHYPAGMDPDKEGSLMYGDFQIENQWFTAMDSAHQHNFTFTEALSLIVNCDTQEEIDYYWDKLSAVPEAEQCGWLKDTYGVSWQVNPTRLDEMMRQGTPEQVQRVTQAFLKMKKFDLATLEKAFAHSA